jgi:putative transposase
MKEYYRRHLPHYHPHHAVYFITFRLINSLPNRIIEQLKEEYSIAAEIQKRRMNFSRLIDHMNEAEERHRRYFEEFDRFLDDQTSGNQWLGMDAIAAIVANAIHFRDRKVYDLLSYTIMPNHVHMICTIDAATISEQRTGYGSRISPVTTILHSLKRYTAHECNALLGRQGAFWQSESYDHIVRSEQELDRTIRYVVYNPVKAGLVKDVSEWKFSYCKYPL